MGSRERPEPHPRGGEEPPRLVPVAPALVGRGHPGRLLRELRPAGARCARHGARGRADAAALVGRVVRAADRGLPAGGLRLPALQRRGPVPARDRRARRVVRLGLDAPRDPGPAPRAAARVGGSARRHGQRRLLRGSRPAPRLVQLLAHGRRGRRRPRALHRGVHARLGAGRPGPRHAQVDRQRGLAADADRQARRRRRALVGAGHRLARRRARRRRDPAARGGRLPQGPQHVSLPARQPRGFRSGAGAAPRAAHGSGPRLRRPPRRAPGAPARRLGRRLQAVEGQPAGL